MSLVRPLLTGVVFAVLPQCYGGQPYVWRGPPCSVQDFITFADAAPRPSNGLRYGFFVRGSGIRCYKCPAWFDSLQQAEFLALVQAFKIAGYTGWCRVAVGSDSTVARSQVLSLRCGTSLPVQNRTLRHLFWWRRWSRVQLAVSYVPSDKKPADPPSRRPRFVDREACMRAALHRDRCEGHGGEPRSAGACEPRSMPDLVVTVSTMPSALAVRPHDSRGTPGGVRSPSPREGALSQRCVHQGLDQALDLRQRWDRGVQELRLQWRRCCTGMCSTWQRQGKARPGTEGVARFLTLC